jgi:hypothetical protein
MIDPALFVSEALHEKEVTLGDGTKHMVHLKELPAVEFRKLHDSESDGMATLIALSWVTPDGKPALTLKDVNRLKPNVFSALVTAIMEVNGFGAKND